MMKKRKISEKTVEFKALTKYKKRTIIKQKEVDFMRNDDTVTIFFRALAITLSIAIITVSLLYGAFLYFTKNMTGEVYNPNVSVNVEDEFIYEEAGENLKDRIKKWYDNGQPAKADGVLNILLIGMDIDTKDMSKNSRADAMLLVSVNQNTKEIKMVSLLRDQYCYMVHKGKESYEKLHHANNYGGPEMQIDLIEKYYKISIDNYALVNFYSLPKIIDKMDGVTVSITKNEAEYMNTYWGTKVKTGENRLDGDTALIYMRIRHQTGGDTARVGRQQQVLKSIMNEVGTMNKGQLISVISEMTKYVRTGYSSENLLSLATEAFVNGWFNYAVKNLSFPDETCAVDSTINGAWYWLVDYPIAAQGLQTELFGKSNIVLLENRRYWV